MASEDAKLCMLVDKARTPWNTHDRHFVWKSDADAIFRGRERKLQYRPEKTLNPWKLKSQKLHKRRKFSLAIRVYQFNPELSFYARNKLIAGLIFCDDLYYRQRRCQ